MTSKKAIKAKIMCFYAIMISTKKGEDGKAVIAFINAVYTAI